MSIVFWTKFLWFLGSFPQWGGVAKATRKELFEKRSSLRDGCSSLGKPRVSSQFSLAPSRRRAIVEITTFFDAFFPLLSSRIKMLECCSFDCWLLTTFSRKPLRVAFYVLCGGCNVECDVECVLNRNSGIDGKWNKKEGNCEW